MSSPANIHDFGEKLLKILDMEGQHVSEVTIRVTGNDLVKVYITKDLYDTEAQEFLKLLETYQLVPKAEVYKAPEIAPLDKQFEKVLERYPGATLTESSSGTVGGHLVMIPHFPLPPGYTKPTCTVYFVAPAGYPWAHPIRFFTSEVRLQAGGMPDCTKELDASDSIHGFPAIPGTMHWFWQIQAWDARSNDLMTYVRVIKSRLHKVT